MIGDGSNDIGAGKNAGCKAILIDEIVSHDYDQDSSVNGLL